MSKQKRTLKGVIESGKSTEKKEIIKSTRVPLPGPIPPMPRKPKPEQQQQRPRAESKPKRSSKK